MIRFRQIFLLTASVVLLWSCRSAQGIENIPGLSQTVTKEEKGMLSKKISEKKDFSFLKVKGNLSLKDKGKKKGPKLSITMYINHGNSIWGNLSYYVTAGRFLIEKDRIQVYEKIGSTYIDENLTDLGEILGISGLSQSTVEQLLLGGVLNTLNIEDFNLYKQGADFVLISKKPKKIDYKNKTKEFYIKMTLDKEYNLIKESLENIADKELFSINYSEYDTAGFPKEVSLDIAKGGDKKIEAILSYSSIEKLTEDVGMSFKIPENYTKKEIKIYE